MRDANRIDPMMMRIAQVWKENFPDWRFMQMINNFQSWLGSDGYYLEDERFEKKLAEFILQFGAPRYVNNSGVGPT